MEIQLYPSMDYACIKMENGIETIRKLMLMLQENNIQIHKFYWRSKLDETYLELQEPKITDVFYFHLDLNGNTKVIKSVLEEYNKIKSTYEYLDKCLLITTEEEIKQWANKALQNMNIFSIQ